VRLCNSPDEQVKDYAIKVVGFFATETTGFDAGLMREAITEGVASEVALAKYYGEASNQERAAAKLSRLVSGERALLEQMVEMGGIRELVALGFSDNISVQKSCVEAIEKLAEYDEHRIALILEGALSPLITRLMSSTGFGVASKAMECLKKLAVQERAYLHDLRLNDPLFEAQRVVPTALFVGGQEGESIYRWYRLEPISLEEAAVISAQKKGGNKKGALGRMADMMKGGGNSKGRSLNASNHATPRDHEDRMLMIANGDDDTPLTLPSDVDSGGSGVVDMTTNPLALAITGSSGAEVNELNGPNRGLTGLSFKPQTSHRTNDMMQLTSRTDGSDVSLTLLDTARSDVTEGGTNLTGSTKMVHYEVQEDIKEAFLMREVSREKQYIPTSGDVDHRLLFYWLPVSITGVKGASRKVVTLREVFPANPNVKAVRIMRVHPKESLLVGWGEYIGGEEGESVFVWRRVMKGGEKSVIRNECNKTYLPKDADVGNRVEFGYVPVRSDGIRGRVEWSTASEVIVRYPPSFHGFRIDGSPEEGVTIRADGVFRGGREGSHETKWYRQQPEGKRELDPETGEYTWEHIPKLDDTRSYILGRGDLDCIVKCICVPVSDKGIRGPRVEAVAGPIAHGLPCLAKLTVVGGPAHTKPCRCNGQYFGGVEGDTIIICM